MGQRACSCEDAGESKAKHSQEVIRSHSNAGSETSAGYRLQSPTTQGQPSDASLSPSNRFQRRAILEVDEAVLRGVPLRATLWQGGRLWRKPPSEAHRQGQNSFYDRSLPTPELDMFVSHSWSEGGAWKAFALLLQFGWRNILACWAFAVTVSVFLTANDVLPTPFQYDVQAVSFKALCPMGPWIFISGLVGVILGVLLSVYLPESWSRSPTCFVDRACIHPTDQAQAERGIYGIGGFLRVSRELRVLWSPRYFSRLWCVFEIAAFRTASPGGKITMAPLFMEKMVLCGWLVMVSGLGIFLTFRSRPEWRQLSLIPYAIMALPLLPGVHALRRNYLAKHRLLDELETFDLAHVVCEREFDRHLIHGAIADWYGSAQQFAEFVRGPLRQELMAPVLSCNIPREYILVLVAMPVSLHLDFVLAIAKMKAPLESIAAYSLSIIVGVDILLLPAALILAVALSDRFAQPLRSGLFIDVLQSSIMFLIVAVVLVLGNALAAGAARSSLGASCAWTAASAAFLLGTQRLTAAAGGKPKGPTAVAASSRDAEAESVSPSDFFEV